jgi:sugar phosphate isomerase/epimerase
MFVIQIGCDLLFFSSPMKTRREFLTFTAGALCLADSAMLFGAGAKALWKVGICDWDLRAAGRLGAFAAAKELGCEGIQVSYQPTGQDSIAVKENREKFLAAAKETGVEIASLAMGLLNGSPLATTPEAELWGVDCLNAMDEMNVDQVLLAFFGNADLTQHNDHMPLVIEKLKRLAPVAERKKKILAVESYLSAEDHLKLLDAVGSDAVKVYYDVTNSKNKGYNIFHEMKLLGSKKLISQIHFKENSVRLGDGEIDFPKVCETLADIDYQGWLVVESSAPGDWKESQAANVRYVKKLIGR